MFSLLSKAFAALLMASIGTTAFASHAPNREHGPRVLHLSPAVLEAVETPAQRQSEWLLLHPSKPLYVAPPPEPAAPADADKDVSASAPVSPAGSTPTSRPPASAPLPASPRPVVIGSAQQAMINADRAAAGLPPLTWSGCLAGIAAGQASAMAARLQIFHGSGVTQDFGCGLGSAQTGENVGYWSAGVNDAQLNTLFMNSPEHRANIMGPYRYVGTAWVVGGNGAGYVAVEFG